MKRDLTRRLRHGVLASVSLSGASTLAGRAPTSSPETRMATLLAGAMLAAVVVSWPYGSKQSAG
ncbi:hypothetical protein O7632_05885 [Solwaraspora sp. WMMD406]|uniref:hypothetical protein n=1 Tax=Solwaraspora sp. WMMD406 TaxID=3016095 RepID=UPI00241643EF|nr:hypothetical protein [Solwaraspora sp. WMMD406]MDG4763642.1 hypothetical protein [Solwaraspora sp. WMMD406]